MLRDRSHSMLKQIGDGACHFKIYCSLSLLKARIMVELIVAYTLPGVCNSALPDAYPFLFTLNTTHPQQEHLPQLQPLYLLLHVQNTLH